MNAPVNRDALIMQWQEAQRNLATAKAAEVELRNMVLQLCFPTVAEGVNRFELGQGYSLKATGRLDYTLEKDKDKVDAALDEIERTGNEGPFLAERLVKWKPELSVGEYKKLADGPIKMAISRVLTIKPCQPSLELETPKGNGK